MEDGGYFASALMRFAVQLVSEGVEMADPFSEEVCEGSGHGEGP